jgi:fructose-1,6-bisphosphatase
MKPIRRLNHLPSSKELTHQQSWLECYTKLNENGKFFVTFDPLDGSSIIDSNLAIGTIAGIWRKKEGQDDCLGFIAREDMVGAALSCYGSRTNIVLYNTLTKTVDELTL